MFHSVHFIIVHRVFFKKAKLKLIKYVLFVPINEIPITYFSHCNFKVRFYRCRMQLNSNPLSNLSVAQPFLTCFDSEKPHNRIFSKKTN